jgi:hypothetical protein
MTINNLENAGKIWLPEEVDQLIRAFAEDEPLEAIAIMHGRTPYAILGKLIERGLLVARGDNYYRMEQDPWILGHVVRQLHRELKK